MKQEGFSITNISILGKTPCCDLVLVIDGTQVWQKSQVPFDEIKQIMQEYKENADAVVKHLNSIHKK
jgi:hypothetical protein